MSLGSVSYASDVFILLARDLAGSRSRLTSNDFCSGLLAIRFRLLVIRAFALAYSVNNYDLAPY